MKQLLIRVFICSHKGHQWPYNESIYTKVCKRCGISWWHENGR